MNTAVRTLTQGIVTPRRLAQSLFCKEQSIVGGLLTAVILSALMVVYVSNQAREASEFLQQQQMQTEHYQVQYGQLLLERTAFSTQAHVQQVAATRLMMSSPTKVMTVSE